MPAVTPETATEKAGKLPKKQRRKSASGFVIIGIIGKKDAENGLAVHPQVNNAQNYGHRPEQIQQIIPVKLIGAHHHILTGNSDKSDRNRRNNKADYKSQCPDAVQHARFDHKRRQHIDQKQSQKQIQFHNASLPLKIKPEVYIILRRRISIRRNAPRDRPPLSPETQISVPF